MPKVAEELCPICDTATSRFDECFDQMIRWYQKQYFEIESIDISR